jgi:Family of unknown function (DUF5675)
MIQLLLERDIRTPKSTTSRLSINGQTICFMLEDVDRNLRADMTLDEINNSKVYGRTAIPTGRYKVVITHSPRFKRKLPLLVNVPGYKGVRIHAGNTAENTEGCLLPGTTRTKDFVHHSRLAFQKLYNIIETALDSGEDVYITITSI